jgi:hypothetical protein
MANFPYTISLSNLLVQDCRDYAEYVHSVYVEDVDYIIDDTASERASISNVDFSSHLFEVLKLMVAYRISFKNEEDALDFKLRFDL